MKKALGLTLAGFLVLGGLVGCGNKTEETSKPADKPAAKPEEKKVLVMGTSADYAPFEYIDTAKSEEIIGFDVDLAKAIGEKTGYEIKVVDNDFTTLLEGMSAKKFDFVMAGMTPNEERLQQADFTEIYYRAKNLLVFKKDAGYKGIEDLKGKTVGVQAGSVQEGKAEDFNETVAFGKIETRNRIPEIIQELKSGRFDAVIMEDSVAKGYLEKFDDLGSTLIMQGAEEGGSAIAFPKGSPLTAEFNKAITELRDAGEIDKLIVKWFDQQ